MLEFLGLESDALKVTVCLFIIAVMFGPPIGITTADDNSKAAKVFFVIAAIVSVIALLIGAWPLFMLFITFQWKYILLPLVGAVAVLALLAFIFYSITIARKKAKYRKNPIIKEAAKFFKENDIVGIQCHCNGIRFFTYLPNAKYCSSETVSRESESKYDKSYLENLDFRPEHWKEYDITPAVCHHIKFADRGYPNLENLDVFAKALASYLSGVSIATHKASYTYDEYVSRAYSDTGTAKNIKHVIYKQDDRFIYKKSALAELKKREKAEKKAAPKPEKTNKWE